MCRSRLLRGNSPSPLRHHRASLWANSSAVISCSADIDATLTTGLVGLQGLTRVPPVPLPLHGGEILFARAPSRPSAELPRSTPPTPGLRPAVPSPIAALRGTNPSTGE